MYLETCFGDVTLKFFEYLEYQKKGDISVIIEDRLEIDADGKKKQKEIIFDLKEHEALYLAKLILMAVESARAENDRKLFENPNEY